MNRIFFDAALSAENFCDEPDTGDPLKGRKEQVIARMYQQHRQDILSHLLTMVKNREIAEELLQDSFIRLSRVPGIEVIRQPRAFLTKIATNLALDYLRQQKKVPAFETTDDAFDSLIAPQPEQLDEVIKERHLNQLKQAISQLPDRAREALMLAKFKEMTLKEVAREMDISQTMVEKHLKTALQKCRAALTSDIH
ncbi:RNA polymerase sigma factor [Oceanospirillum sediminis]|uniref:Sigma-70 family RNA polymerase sigma factor n=1 Tax=Oceanospirillum sediminis TaxID=2760088 RepID=A0A839IJ92_9GAMM|nr:sigma-70 family RNA polymerase sigma factor [Oceanospirillum sediminis]MBB1485413.1 sigma-70 family RNA polymerase sigma factor [Oceanospirillum sediminis]